MNIFVLSEDPSLAAKYQCDSHIVKMTLETAQMLSTAVRVTNGDVKVIPDLIPLTKDGSKTELYKASYVNHPCTIWARTTKGNFAWLKAHGMALSKEYTYRYGKTHAAMPIIYSASPNTIPNGPLTPFEQCMPDEYKSLDAVEAYRKLYIYEKTFAKWSKNREAPSWYFKPER